MIGWVVGPLVKRGLEKVTAQRIVIGLTALLFGLAIFAVARMVDRIGDARVEAALTEERLAQARADAELLRRAEAAGQAARQAEIVRQAKRDEQVSEEREKIDEAIANGGSPADVFFGVRD